MILFTFIIFFKAISTIPEIYAQHADKAKQSEFAVVTLFSLATRHCCNAMDLRQILEQHEVDVLAVDEFIRCFEENKKDLVLRQIQVGHSFPHITDVQWRIVCDVKTSSCNSSSGELGFQINLGRYRQDIGERETIVEFLCNTEELQSLINKLKEVERHCEKIATQ